MALDAVNTLLLRRERAVCLAPLPEHSDGAARADVSAFEADLLALGAILSSELRDRVAQTMKVEFAGVAEDVLAALAA